MTHNPKQKKNTFQKINPVILEIYKYLTNSEITAFESTSIKNSVIRPLQKLEYKYPSHTLLFHKRFNEAQNLSFIKFPYNIRNFLGLVPLPKQVVITEIPYNKLRKNKGEIRLGLVGLVGLGVQELELHFITEKCEKIDDVFLKICKLCKDEFCSMVLYKYGGNSVFFNNTNGI